MRPVRDQRVCLEMGDPHRASRVNKDAGAMRSISRWNLHRPNFLRDLQHLLLLHECTTRARKGKATMHPTFVPANGCHLIVTAERERTR